jgi:CheY-like chemotaxis protein
VEDTGFGMSRETLERVFEPFFTSKESGHGTGLGLSVAYGIISQHGGWITAYSEPGAGSTFKIYLPAESAGVDDRDELEEPEAPAYGRGERILVVEDEEDLRRFSEKMLTKYGYVVLAAGTVQEAVEMARKENLQLDLVFSDVVLPDGTGLQLVDAILAENPNVPVLMTSGYTDQRLDWSTIDARGFSFIHKPFGLVDLLRAVSEALAADTNG